MAQLSDYLAAERTVLAWLRTGLALMGFGFVVARFGIFLQQIQIVAHGPAVRSLGLSLWFGTALIVAGVVVNVLAGVRHVRLVRELNEDQMGSARSLTPILIVAGFLALVGLAMAVYLFAAGTHVNLQQ